MLTFGGISYAWRIINTVAVIAGNLIGLLFKKGIPQKFTDAVMIGIGLCSLYIGISGALGENALILIGAIAVGAIIGTALDLDGRLNQLGDAIGRRTSRGEGMSPLPRDSSPRRCSCVGAATIVGSRMPG